MYLCHCTIASINILTLHLPSHTNVLFISIINKPTTHITHHTSYITHWTSHIIHQISHITHHTSQIKHIPPRPLSRIKWTPHPWAACHTIIEHWLIMLDEYSRVRSGRIWETWRQQHLLDSERLLTLQDQQWPWIKTILQPTDVQT